MKTVFILGSSNLESRCAKLTRLLADRLAGQGEVVTLFPSQLDIHPCLGCEYCLAHQNQCIYKDQMDIVYQEIREADVLVFISPVYFSNIPSTLKKVIDRCQLFYNLRDKSSIVDKKFIAIHTGGAPAYATQFEAFRLTYQVLLPDFKADLMSFHTFSNADSQNPLEDREFISNIWQSLERAVNNKGENNA